MFMRAGCNNTAPPCPKTRIMHMHPCPPCCKVGDLTDKASVKKALKQGDSGSGGAPSCSDVTHVYHCAFLTSGDDAKDDQDNLVSIG